MINNVGCQKCGEERWKAAFNNFYEISTSGRIRRLAHGIQGSRPGKLLSPQKHSAGYLMVLISIKGKKKHHLIHRLVAEAFLGANSHLEVNHKDGDKTHNCLTNLEYVTPKQNGEHASRNGLCNRGVEVSSAKLTEEDVRKIRAIYSATKAVKSIMKQFSISRSAVYHIVLHQTWSHI